MREFLANLLAGLRNVIRAEPWDPPARDETTPAAFREWVDKHKPEGR